MTPDATPTRADFAARVIGVMRERGLQGGITAFDRAYDSRRFRARRLLALSAL